MNICHLSNNGLCEFAKSKYFNYGFFQGTGEYCGMDDKWVDKLDACPKEKENPEFLEGGGDGLA